MEIHNDTPLAAGMVVLFDVEAAERLCVSVRAVYELTEQGRLTLAAEQPQLSPSDAFAGEPGQSSILREADLGYAKLSTDVSLTGWALCGRRPVKEREISIRVGQVSKRLRVTGERWTEGWLERGPLEFERVPLRWELAAGGTDTSAEDVRHHGMDLRNPLGRGFRAKRSRLPRARALPQILSVGRDKSEPAGFGLIGESWLPRRSYAGTYDEAWQRDRFPLLPLDFDPRFHNKAAPGLVARRHLRGGEPFEVVGCTPDDVVRGELPRTAPFAVARVGDRDEPFDLALAGVAFDMEAMQLRLLWRGDMAIHRRLPRLRSVAISAREASA